MKHFTRRLLLGFFSVSLLLSFQTVAHAATAQYPCDAEFAYRLNGPTSGQYTITGGVNVSGCANTPGGAVYSNVQVQSSASWSGIWTAKGDVFNPTRYVGSSSGPSTGMIGCGTDSDASSYCGKLSLWIEAPWQQNGTLSWASAVFSGYSNSFTLVNTYPSVPKAFFLQPDRTGNYGVQIDSILVGDVLCPDNSGGHFSVPSASVVYCVSGTTDPFYYYDSGCVQQLSDRKTVAVGTCAMISTGGCDGAGDCPGKLKPPPTPSCTASQGSVVAGQIVTFNASSAPGTPNYTYTWTDVNTGVAGGAVGPVLTSTKAVNTASFVPGTYRMQVAVQDANNFVGGPANCSFAVIAAPDLTATVSATPTTLIQGGSFTLNGGAVDNNVASVPTTFSNKFQESIDNVTFSDVSGGGSTTGGILAGQTVAVPALTITPTVGTHYYRLCADSTNTIIESNEFNNCSNATVVTVIPTLTATCARVSPAGNLIDISNTVTWNITASGGTGVYTYSWKVVQQNGATLLPTGNPLAVNFTTYGQKTASGNVTSGTQTLSNIVCAQGNLNISPKLQVNVIGTGVVNTVSNYNTSGETNDGFVVCGSTCSHIYAYPNSSGVAATPGLHVSGFPVGATISWVGCTVASGDQTRCLVPSMFADTTVTVTITPPPLGCTLSASVNPVDYGTAPTLTWTTSGNPTSATASGGWSGSKATTGGTQSQSTITNDTTYTLTVSKVGMTDGNCSVTVGVQPVAPTLSVSTGPTCGGSMVLSLSGGAGATGYDISRYDNATGVWSVIASNVAPASFPYTDSGLTKSGSYTYQVKARRGATYQSLTNVPAVKNASAACPINPPTVSATFTPACLSGVSTGQNTISWVAGAVDATHVAASYYNLFDNGTQIPGNILSLSKVQTNISAGASHDYSVIAVGPDGQQSTESFAPTVVIPACLIAPTVNLSIRKAGTVTFFNAPATVDVLYGNGVELSWSNSSAQTCDLRNGAGTLLSSALSSALFPQNNLTASSYSYTLTCTNAVGSASATVSANVGPSAPSMTATGGACGGNVNMTFNPSVNATSYVLSQQPFSAFDNTAGDIKTYPAASLPLSDSIATFDTNRSFTYQLRAVGTNSMTAYSSIVSTNSSSLCAPAFTSSSCSAGTVNLAWTNTGGATYRLQEAVGAGSYSTVQNNASRTYTRAGVNGTTYNYKLEAVNSKALTAGDFSAPVVTVAVNCSAALQTDLISPTAPTVTGTVFGNGFASGQPITLSGALVKEQGGLGTAVTPINSVYKYSTDNITFFALGAPGATVANAGGLQAGGQQTVPSYVHATSVLASDQQYYFQVCVDSGNAVTESNEGNNCSPSVPVLFKASVSAPTVSLNGRINGSGSAYTAGPLVLNYGQTVDLQWSATNADSCSSGAQAWTAQTGTSGTQLNVGPLAVATYTYMITCTGPGGASSASVVVNVKPAPAVVTVPNPATCSSSFVPTWPNATLASSYTISIDGAGPIPAISGMTYTLSMNSIHTFQVQSINANGSTNSNIASALSNCVIPVVTLQARKLPAGTFAGSITIGTTDTFELQWTTTNTPTSCFASGSWSGSKSTSAGPTTQSPLGPLAVGTYTYTLQCTNAQGSGSASATVTVANVVANPPIVGCAAQSGGFSGPFKIGEAFSWSSAVAPGTGTAPYTYAWTGISTGSGATLSVPSGLSTSGTKSETLTVTDSVGQTGTANCTVVISPMTVSCVASPSATTPNTTVTWTGTASNGSGGYTYSWSGASLSGSGSTKTQSYASSGTYTATVTATDSAGNTASGNCSVTVDLAPQCSVVLGGRKTLTSNSYTSSLTVAYQGGIDLQWTGVAVPSNSPATALSSQTTAWNNTQQTIDSTPRTLTLGSLPSATNQTFTLQCTDTVSTKSAVVTVSMTPQTPNAPSGSVGGSCNAGSVTLTWTAAALATSYNVYDAGTGTLLGNTTGLTYTQSGLSDAIYSYQIEAVNANGLSAKSGITSVVVSLCTPTGITSVTCSPSSASPSANQAVTWTASVSGGTAPLTYTWSGATAGTGNPLIVAGGYSSGTQTESISVTDSLGSTSSGSCSLSVVNTFTASCSASPSSAAVNVDTASWTATATNGTAPYTYAWTGDSPLNSKTGASPAPFTYGSVGFKSGHVTVTDAGGAIAFADCSNGVTVTNPSGGACDFTLIPNPAEVTMNFIGSKAASSRSNVTVLSTGCSDTITYTATPSKLGSNDVNVTHNFFTKGSNTKTSTVDSGTYTQGLDFSVLANQLIQQASGKFPAKFTVTVTGTGTTIDGATGLPIKRSVDIIVNVNKVSGNIIEF